jgi:hypothetical protein
LKLFFDNGDQHVSGDGTPDLRLHCVLRRSQELLDSQMLFDPLKEQLDLPATLIERCIGLVDSRRIDSSSPHIGFGSNHKERLPLIQRVESFEIRYPRSIT